MRTLYRVWSAALGEAQIARIVDAAGARPSETAKTFSSIGDAEGVRSATIRWLEEPWLRELLWGYIEQANSEDFHFDLDGLAEVQLITYSSGSQDHYGWHHDVDWGSDGDDDRKLSVTVQLSESNAYDGGDLEFAALKTNADFRSRGTVIVFPSTLRHRVTSVSQGQRLSLVAWFSGPRWR